MFLALFALSLIGGSVAASDRSAGLATIETGAATPIDTLARGPVEPPLEHLENPQPAESHPAAAAATSGAPAGAATVGERTFDQPRWVMVRSLLLPGWGQWHNHSFVKAAAIGGVEGWLGVRMVRDGRSFDRLRRDVETAQQGADDARAVAAVAAYNRRLDRFVAGQWMLAGIVTYALLDAYVDAHFRHFKVEFEHDPALPEGFSSGTGVRLLLRWGY